MKKCPFCAENIQEEAILCRYCGKKLSSNAHLSKRIDNFGNILVIAGGLLGELYAIFIVASEWGLLGAGAALMFFPVAIAVAPIYALIVFGAWLPLLIIYGLIGLGMILIANAGG